MAFSGFVGASMSEREALDNMATAFSKRGSDLGRADETKIDRLHSKSGQRVEKRYFSANASVDGRFPKGGVANRPHRFPVAYKRPRCPHEIR